MRVSGQSFTTRLLTSAAAFASVFIPAGSAFAYSSSGSTVVAGSGYQANSAYAQSAGTQPVGSQPGSSAAYAYQPAAQQPVMDQPAPVQQPVEQDSTTSVYTNGYSGPMGPNAQKAFEAGQPMPQPQPQPAAYPAGSQIVSNPQQIQYCLCLQTRYEMLSNDSTAKQTAYNQAVAQRADLDSQIAAAKAGPSSPDRVEHIRELNARRIALQQQINQQYIPEQQGSTERYNEAVGQYQQSCAGKDFDSTVLARVKTGLVCQGQ